MQFELASPSVPCNVLPHVEDPTAEDFSTFIQVDHEECSASAEGFRSDMSHAEANLVLILTEHLVTILNRMCTHLCLPMYQRM